MRKIISIFIALCLTYSVSQAHDTAYTLAPGQIDVSVYWVPTDGLNADIYYMENLDSELTNFGYHVISSRFNAGPAGLDSLFEIGATSWLSMGFRLNIPQAIISGISGSGYNLSGSFFTRLLMVESYPIGAQLLLEFEGTSFLGERNKMSWVDGYFNIFVDLSSYYHFIKTDTKAFSAYLDGKFMTTLENPVYRDPISDFETMLGYPPGSCALLPSQIGPIFRFALAPGLEAKLGKFIFHLGFNVPIVSFHRYYITSVFFNRYPPDLTNIEFGWRYRF